MKGEGRSWKRIAQAMGTIMMVAWALILGTVGCLLLVGTAYSMVAGNLVAGIVCLVLFFLPFFLTVAWGVAKCFQLLREKRTQDAAFLMTTEQIPFPNG